MFRPSSIAAWGSCRFPRMRGDVPRGMLGLSNPQQFSPHARGCSANLSNAGVVKVVFPACAGMFRTQKRVIVVYIGFPRMRGDVPKPPKVQQHQVQFSPHARGCSAPVRGQDDSSRVFPACAGMFRRDRPRHQRVQRFPRMRGDVPTLYIRNNADV